MYTLHALQTYEVLNYGSPNYGHNNNNSGDIVLMNLPYFYLNI